MPATPVEAAWRDFVFADVWSRPGLDTRSRFIIAIVGAADAPGGADILDGYLRGAIETKTLTVTELREIALHMTGYAGFVQATALDQAITRAVGELGLEEPPFRPIYTEELTLEQRHANGYAAFEKAIGFKGATPADPFLSVGISNYVFAELWTRPELDRRSRRLVTLVAAADTQAPSAVRAHVYSAMATGDLSKAEMEEFVLQYAVQGGHTRASTMEQLVGEMSAKIAKGEPLNLQQHR